MQILVLLKEEEEEEEVKVEDTVKEAEEEEEVKVDHTVKEVEEEEVMVEEEEEVKVEDTVKEVVEEEEEEEEEEEDTEGDLEVGEIFMEVEVQVEDQEAEVLEEEDIIREAIKGDLLYLIYFILIFYNKNCSNVCCAFSPFDLPRPRVTFVIKTNRDNFNIFLSGGKGVGYRARFPS